MNYRPFFSHTKLWAFGLPILFMGCAGGYRNAPVEPDLARSTLNTALSAWKSGSTVDSLRAQSPEIVVQDTDWSKGAKLVDFEVLGAGEPVDANLVAKVELSLESGGKPVSKTVTYVVGTSPVLTVFRDPMR